MVESISREIVEEEEKDEEKGGKRNKNEYGSNVSDEKNRQAKETANIGPFPYVIFLLGFVG